MFSSSIRHNAFNNCPAPAPRPATPRFPLVNCSPVLINVVHAALNARAEAGHYWLHLAATSSANFDMAALVYAAPAPLLHPLTPTHLHRLYAAALRPARTPFDQVNPSTTLHALLHHVARNAPDVSRCALITACVYIDRLTQAAPHMFVTTTNVHRLFAVAFMLAAKWHEDTYFSSAYFAALFAIPLTELIALEAAFVRALNYHLFVTTEHFRDAQVALMARALDSAEGLTVYRALVHHRVADLHNAFDLTRSWRHHAPAQVVSVAPPLAPHHVWAVAADLLRHRHQPAAAAPSHLADARCAVAALARAQLRHDFPQLSEHTYVSELQRRFTDDAVFRYAKLQLLAQSEELDDLVLPPLQRLPPPPPPPPPPRPAASPPCHDAARDAPPGHRDGVRGFGAFLVNAAACLAESYEPPRPFIPWARWPHVPAMCSAAGGVTTAAAVCVESPCATRAFPEVCVPPSLAKVSEVCVPPSLAKPTSKWSTSSKFVDCCPVRGL